MGKKILFIDNFDSFTYNLVDYFIQAGANCQVVRNDIDISTFKKSEIGGIVLSPGPGIPSKSGKLMDIIHEFHQTVPLLGICLGHQAIGEYFGAKLIKAKIPKHGKKSTIFCIQDPILKNIPNEFDVVRYHSMLIELLPDELKIVGKTQEDEIMLIRHRNLPIYGIQYHPEAFLTEYGKEIIQNWLQLVQEGD